MTKTLFHPTTDAAIQKMAARLPHALGIYGEQGIGLLTAAKQVSHAVATKPLVIYPRKNEEIDRAAGSHSIDTIRGLYQLTNSKRGEDGQVIIVVDADKMSREASNAFLKLLEEPVEGVHFILLTHSYHLLLPTIRSRMQSIRLQPITANQSNELLDELAVQDSTRRAQLLFLAEGKPALLHQLAHDSELFKAESELLIQAKEFIAAPQYTRLKMIQSFRSSRADAQKFLSYITTLVCHTIYTTKDATTAAESLLVRAEKAHRKLYQNANVRLSLAEVALDITE